MRTLVGEVIEDARKPYAAMTGHKVDKIYRCIRSMVGPGGLDCACCLPMPITKLKPISRRMLRRKLKQNLVKELED